MDSLLSVPSYVNGIYNKLKVEDGFSVLPSVAVCFSVKLASSLSL